MPNTEPLLTTAEVATRCKVHPETVRRWAREGSLKAITLPGGQKRYDPAEVAVLTGSAA